MISLLMRADKNWEGRLAREREAKVAGDEDLKTLASC